MNIFEQISCIYFERNRSEGLKNLFVLSLENSSFSHTKTKLEKERENDTSGR
jgi:hypothetical protein